VVVLVRPTGIDTDSRVKKLAVSLTRLGYDATILGRSATGAEQRGRIGRAEVLLVPPRSRLRGTPARAVRLPARLRRVEKKANALAQRAEKRAHQRLREDKRGHYLWWRAQRDFATTYGTELERLAPDVIHVHDPRLLPVAVRAARRIERRTRRPVRLVYDARENFAGWPPENITMPAYHAHLLRAEHRAMRRVSVLLTVGEDTARSLTERLPVPGRPVVLLNMPVAGAVSPGRSLRADAGVAPDVPLLAYPGAATRARGVDTLIEALPLMPDVHAALVVVPYPHPREAELRDRAEELGVAERLHIVPPVDADAVPGYLAEADATVSTILTGPANHEASLPNKLFEMLHSGRPVITTDIRAMSRWVEENKVGVVYRSGDAADLARAVAEVLADPAPWTDPERRAELARRWSWQAQEDVIAEAYGRVAPTNAPRDTGPFPRLIVQDWPITVRG
jgi:glycosyltransferase involved in cell wall biosynthesis